MSDKREQLLKEYDNNRPLLEAFALNMQRLVGAILGSTPIRVHVVTARVKERKSLEKKIVDKDYKYNTLSDITDIIGLRIITYFEDEVDKVGLELRRRFWLDYPNCQDTRHGSLNVFGYQSLHYVCFLRETEVDHYLLSGLDFKGMKFEVQIRSILQHSWAEIQHDLGYKSRYKLPSQAKRTFARVAALLEMADIEFVKLRTELRAFEEKVKQEIQANPDLVEINKFSVQDFIEKPLVVDLERQITLDADLYVSEDPPGFDCVDELLLEDIRDLEIMTIQKLEGLYIKFKEEIYNYGVALKAHDTPNSRSGFTKGATVKWLCIAMRQSQNSYVEVKS